MDSTATLLPPWRVAFVGLGAMGRGMAANLQRHMRSSTPPAAPEGREPDPTLLLFNRDLSKCAPLCSDPQLACARCPSLLDVAQCANVIFTMLAHDGAVQDVMSALLSPSLTRPPGPLVVVDCSTVLPETTKAMAAVAQEAGIAYVAAPVFGRPDVAAAGRLLGLVAGPAAAKAIVVPYIRGMTRTVLDLGEAPQQANVMKLVGNFHIVGLIEVLAEGMTLSDKNGIPRDTHLDFLREFFQGSAPIMGYGSRMAADDFGAGEGFTVSLGVKDVGHMRRLGEASGCPLPVADLAMQHLVSAKANGRGDMDWAALATSVRQAAGAPPL